jgi:hypothetical protein
MSNFNKLTWHPVTGKLEMATWLDGHFAGPHYGVRFDDGHVYNEIYIRPYRGVPEAKPIKAYDAQVGGDHYKKLKIQPMQYSMANELDACQHTAIKYITRHEDKAGKKDLYKALHVTMLLIEEKYEWDDNDSAILAAVMGAMQK